MSGGGNEAAKPASAEVIRTPSESPANAHPGERMMPTGPTGSTSRLIAVIDTERAPAFAHVGNGGTVVCPSAELGTGLSELPTRARRVFAYLRQQIAALERLHPEDSPATAC